MGLLLNSGDSCFRHRDEAAAKFHAGKEFSLPEQIGREFVKMKGESTGPGVVIMNMWARGGTSERSKILCFISWYQVSPKNQCTTPYPFLPHLHQNCNPQRNDFTGQGETILLSPMHESWSKIKYSSQHLFQPCF